MPEELESGRGEMSRSDIDAYCIDMLEQIAVMQERQRPRFGHQIRTCAVELAALATRPKPGDAAPSSR